MKVKIWNAYQGIIREIEVPNLNVIIPVVPLKIGFIMFKEDEVTVCLEHTLSKSIRNNLWDGEIKTEDVELKNDDCELKIKLIPFDSERGRELLDEMKNEHELTYEQEDLIVEDGLEKWRKKWN